MDRFREFVSKLSLGEQARLGAQSPQPPEDPNITKRMYRLEEIPATKAFAERLPRKRVIQNAAENENKAAKATQLLHRVDDLIQSHVEAARDFRSYVEELSNVKVHLSAAGEQAYAIHQQLLEIDRELNEAESAASRGELDILQQMEDAKFEMYAKSKRAEMNQRKQDYAEKLSSFQKDRYVLSQNFEPGRPRGRISSPVPSLGLSKASPKGKEADLFLSVDEDTSDSFYGPESSVPTQQEPELPKEPLPKARKVKSPGTPKMTPRGPKLATKAPSARPKVDIMADEDFLD